MPLGSGCIPSTTGGSDWSKTARAAARERRQEFLRNFQYAGLGNLTNRERLSLSLVEQRLSSELAAENLRLLSRLSLDGAHQQVFAVVDAMPEESVADYDRLLARLRALPLYVEQHIELWSEQLASGVTQPASVVESCRRRPRRATSRFRGTLAPPRGIWTLSGCHP